MASPARRPPVLLLDVMGTLIYDPFFREIPGFFGLDLEELLAAKHPTAWVEFELGRLTPEQYYARMFQDGRPVDGGALEQHFATAYRWLPGMKPLVHELWQRGVEMHALSNYPVWYRLIEDRLQIARYLRWSFVSCRTGVRKPDARAYLDAAEALDRAPGECLFVDDRSTNCEAAARVGMPSLVYVDADVLRADFRRLGVL